MTILAYIKYGLAILKIFTEAFENIITKFPNWSDYKPNNEN
jgi:hypothetical protein